MHPKRGIVALVVALAWLAAATPALSQQVFKFTALDLTLEILPAEVFEARHGDLANLPRTDEAILNLARELYAPSSLEPGAPERMGECRFLQVDLLLTALKNPAVSDAIRRRVDDLMADAMPFFPHSDLRGKFLIKWTDNDPDARHNITFGEMEATALYLNKYYKLFTDAFTQPMHIRLKKGEELDGPPPPITVRIFYFGDRGNAYVDANLIDLNSKTVVKDPCIRKVVTAHELFHRVQMAYGVTGGQANIKWMVEGTAVWAPKWAMETALIKPPVPDYIVRMNEGLAAPDRNLLLDREYDATHFWVYLAQRGGWQAIKEAWLEFQKQAVKRPAAAVNITTLKRLQLSFESFVHKWHKANYLKSLANATAEYKYEDEGKTYKPCNFTYALKRLTPNASYKILTNNTGFTISGMVRPYGADYYLMPLGPEVTRLRLRVTGAVDGDYSYFFMGVKDNLGQEPVVQTFKTQFDYLKTLNPRQWSNLLVMVTGRAKGGNYSVQVIPAAGPLSCMRGTWLHGPPDSIHDTWKFTITPDDKIMGSYIGWRGPSCTLLAWATYSPMKVELWTQRNVDRIDGCRSITISGYLAGCDTIIGTWKDKYGAQPVTLKKQPPPSAALTQEGPYPQDCPACP